MIGPDGETHSDPPSDQSEPAAFAALQPVEPEDSDERAARKRLQIRRAAVGEFLRKGYASTSVDDIAAAARVSKQTVYKYFGSKEQLFVAIVEATVGDVLDELFARVDPRAGEFDDLEHDLIVMGRRVLELLMQPELLALRRLVTGEGSRFPQLGRAWWHHGPARLIGELAHLLRRLAERGDLVIEDPELDAEQLNWLILSIPLNRAMLSPEQQFSQEQLYRYADAGVRTFLAAHQPA
jgi:AcrR family transcriptional regulator